MKDLLCDAKSWTAEFLDTSDLSVSIRSTARASGNPNASELSANHQSTPRQLELAHQIEPSTQAEQSTDDEYAKRLARMYTKWGPFCGVPEPWRADLKLKDGLKRLLSIYNKVEALGENPVQYLWKSDGLLTQACQASANGKMNSDTIRNALQKLRDQHPGVFPTKDFPSKKRISQHHNDPPALDRSFIQDSTAELEAEELLFTFDHSQTPTSA